MESTKTSPTRAAAAYAAAAKVTARISSSSPAGDTCVVCLHACTTKACACSYMHEQCAASYVKWSGSPTCKVCKGTIVEASELSKRPRELEVESEAEQRARKRLKEKQAEERTAAVEWATSVAPSAAHIILRHFTHLSREKKPPDYLGAPTPPDCSRGLVAARLDQRLAPPASLPRHLRLRRLLRSSDPLVQGQAQPRRGGGSGRGAVGPHAAERPPWCRLAAFAPSYPSLLATGPLSPPSQVQPPPRKGLWRLA